MGVWLLLLNSSEPWKIADSPEWEKILQFCHVADGVLGFLGLVQVEGLSY